MEHTQPESEEEEANTASRRALIASAAGIAAAGAGGHLLGSASAQTPAGEIGTASNPYVRAYVDRKVFNNRTSDPSSPADGTQWYRSDL